ncbi:Membrane-associated guanylate kinase, WW and PDZ domain-containing protein 2 [Microtus ochrogaster]|uniref:Membrane-associated guanylate kinase, WW and PDZ domain-containing protein 2 n=1 Tax=Microtus ochrogaster TaxID=79684 RepID=A0A8J6KY71_MICOH|nr:Membrane-associated guanylate kinase, WW and PDZ domain-containing protein 2 [Microtus ochrogaster]
MRPQVSDAEDGVEREAKGGPHVEVRATSKGREERLWSLMAPMTGNGHKTMDRWETQGSPQTSLSAPAVPQNLPFPPALHRSSFPDSTEAFDPRKPDPYELYEKSRAIYESRRPDYKELDVHLRRMESGFGFRILGGDEPGQPILIGAVIAMGSADRDGRLHPGDELVYVDGIPVAGKTHRYVIDLMHHAARNGQVNLTVRRKVPCGGEPCPENGRSPGSVSTHHSSPRSDYATYANSNHAAPSSNASPPEGFASHSLQTSDVVIHRKENEGFGFVIISSLNRPESGTTITVPHKIGRIIDGSPADRCAKLKVGDRILAVNGQSIVNMPHADIVKLVKDAGLSVTLRIIPQEELNSPVSAPSSEKQSPMAQQHSPLAQPSPATPNSPVAQPAPPQPLQLQGHENSYRSEVKARQDVKPDIRQPPFTDYRQPPLDYRQPPPLDYRQHSPDTRQYPLSDYRQPQDFDYFTVDMEKGAKGFGFSIRGGREYKMDLTSFHLGVRVQVPMELKKIRVSQVLQGLVNLTCTMDLVGKFSSLLQQPVRSWVRLLPTEPPLPVRLCQCNVCIFSPPLPHSGTGDPGSDSLRCQQQPSRVYVGDQIIEINGESTRDMTHARAIELIKSGGRRARLLLKRGTGQVPEYGDVIWYSKTYSILRTESLGAAKNKRSRFAAAGQGHWAMCSFITIMELRAIGYCQVGVPARLDTELAQTEAKGLGPSCALSPVHRRRPGSGGEQNPWARLAAPLAVMGASGDPLRTASRLPARVSDGGGGELEQGPWRALTLCFVSADEPHAWSAAAAAAPGLPEVGVSLEDILSPFSPSHPAPPSDPSPQRGPDPTWDSQRERDVRKPKELAAGGQKKQRLGEQRERSASPQRSSARPKLEEAPGGQGRPEAGRPASEAADGKEALRGRREGPGAEAKGGVRPGSRPAPRPPTGGPVRKVAAVAPGPWKVPGSDKLPGALQPGASAAGR